MHARFELIESTSEIAPGIHLISLVSDKPGTLELRELSLVIETAQGVVLVVGCSHPGIEKIVETASPSIRESTPWLAAFICNGKRCGNSEGRHEPERCLESGFRGSGSLHG
jgi:hypothetical protein